MTGIPHVQTFQGPMPQQQYPPQYAQPPVYQQPMIQQTAPDDVSSLIGKYETDLAKMKKLKKQKERLQRQLEDEENPQPRRNGQEAGFLTIGEEEEDPNAIYDDFDLDELRGMLARVKKGTQEYRYIQSLIEDRELAEEQLDLDELGDELDELIFHAVKVMDPTDDSWQLADSKGTFDDVESLVSSVRKRFPYATKVKWGVVKKGGRTIEALSNRAFSIQSTQTANMKYAKDQQALVEKDRSIPQQPVYIPQQGQQMDLPALIMAMAEQTKATQQTMMQMIAAMKDDSPKESEVDKLVKYQQIFIGPQLEMIKAMQPKGGSNIDPMAMVNVMLTGAQKLAGMSGGGGGGGEGILGMILPILQNFLQQMPQSQQFVPQQQLPGQTQPQYQQQQRQQQLPPPQQSPQGEQVKNPVILALEQKCRKIIENLLSGKLKLEQVPRYIYRNCTPDEGGLVYQMSKTDFEKLLLGSVNRRDPTMQKFIARKDVRNGVQWIHEEFSRLIRVMTILHNQGDEEQAKGMIEWSAGILVETGKLGDEAEQTFRERYEITESDLAGFTGDEDLPPEEEVEEDEELPSGSKSASASKNNLGAAKPKSPTRPQEIKAETVVRPTPKKKKRKKKPSFIKS